MNAPKTILYIEDSEWNVTLVERIFREVSGIEMLSARTALDALGLAERHRCDLVLTDFHLPDLSGDPLLAALRHHPATAQLPIIVVTGEEDPDLAARVLTAGATALVRKPYSAAALIRTALQALSGELPPGEASVPALDRQQSAFLINRLRRPDGTVDEDFVMRFVDSCTVELAELRVALASGDVERTTDVAHRLKGSLSIFGAMTTAERVAELAKIASTDRVGAAAALAASIEETLTLFREDVARLSADHD
jgi:CheY-like chemotaxis protein/HPt (histidine-containing phosphotransfer) domain-containing protein